MRVALRPRRLPYDAEAARMHLLRADRVMRDIVRGVGPCLLQSRGTPYQSLMRALLYQQLAGPAAAAIERRFLALFGGHPPKPDELLAAAPDDLRGAGISRQKASYLYDLAAHAQEGRLDGRRLARASDAEVIEIVTRVRGVGPWTADMLLIFCLGRPDILPTSDLGVRHSIQEAYGLEATPDPGTMLKIAAPWRPYRSVASWYLWRRSDTVTL